MVELYIAAIKNGISVLIDPVTQECDWNAVVEQNVLGNVQVTKDEMFYRRVRLRILQSKTFEIFGSGLGCQ